MTEGVHTDPAGQADKAERQAATALEREEQQHVEKTPAPVVHHDYNPHFTKLFEEVGKLPEYVINALREAVPPTAKPSDTQEAVVHHEATEEGTERVTPGKQGGQNAEHALSAHKNGFASKWFAKRGSK